MAKLIHLAVMGTTLYALDSDGRLWKRPYDLHVWSEDELPPLRPPITKPLRDETEPEGFADFYRAYPRKDARRAAAKAFVMVLRRHPTYTAQNLIESAKAYADQVASNQTEAQYIPMPATWLNQDRFREFFDES